MGNKIEECHMLFEYQNKIGRFVDLHQHFYQTYDEITFLMRFDEIRQKFDGIWPNNILMSRQIICPKSTSDRGLIFSLFLKSM